MMDFKTDREKWAYLAGVIDADGCIGLAKRTVKSVTGYRYQPYLTIAANSRDYLGILKGLVGCGWVNRGNPAGGSQFGLGANDMRDVLPKIKPFLILKKRQLILLETALELLKNNAGKNFKKNEDEMKNNFRQLDDIYDEIKSIQGYGRKR